MASSVPQALPSEDQYCCPLCLENLRWRLPVATKCGHIFCSHCIECALENFCQKCPVCTKPLAEPIFPICLLNTHPGSRKRDTRRRSPRNVSAQHDEHYNCPICGNMVMDCFPMATECGHVFCSTCLKTVTECPVCKREIIEENLVRIYI